MTDKKVYCEDCKYFNIIWDECNYQRGIIAYNMPKRKASIKICASCSIDNEKNTCQYYKKKWWKFWV